MKILWVKAGGLVPLDLGGRIRSYHILQELARRHEVSLFTFYAEQREDGHSALRGMFKAVECVPLRLPQPRSLAERIAYVRNLLSRQPYTLSKFCRPEVRERFGSLIRHENYDVIVCDFIFAAGVIPWDIDTPKVLFTHNVEAVIWKRHYEVASGPLWKLVSWREYRSMSRAEEFYLKRADQVLTVSEADREFFSRLVDPQKITVVPTGVDVEYFQPSAAEQETGLVFTGAMDWMPNEDAVCYFIGEILPRIRRDIPDVKFTIVGREPSDRLRTFARGVDRVHVTGRVDDIRPYVHKASVYVVPLRIGGGTRLKIFEAMAMGKAVVSTSVGAEGLPVTSGDNIILANDPDFFAGEVIRLLRDSNARNALGNAARDLVARKYSWQAVSVEFEKVLQRVVPNPTLGAMNRFATAT